MRGCQLSRSETMGSIIESSLNVWSNKLNWWGVNFIINHSWTLNDCEKSHLWIDQKLVLRKFQSSLTRLTKLSSVKNTIRIWRTNWYGWVCIHVNIINSFWFWRLGILEKTSKITNSNAQRDRKVQSHKTGDYSLPSFWGDDIHYSSM